ncbi:MAG: 4-hydroxy-tetrahydrodipicolinate reductase [Saprospiraceae bacterium]|nr:4-hydroxy-tetrahydrodipicolinate reductase [Saprospiraceae bacterium]
MLRVGLLGYGKMGKAIAALAPRHGVEIAWHAGRTGIPEGLLRSADVVIEFTRPEAAWDNVRACLEAGVPVVSGTTGWQSQLPEAYALCRKQEGALIWASNFSVGVNLFFALNQYLSRLMADRPEYRPDMTETHHVHKLDAPSGTAITLAEQILAHHPDIRTWRLADDDPGADALPIRALREGEAIGTHRIDWRSAIDTITIEHAAQTREGFAAGALLAARWLPGRKGVFTMADVLGLKNH